MSNSNSNKTINKPSLSQEKCNFLQNTNSSKHQNINSLKYQIPELPSYQVHQDIQNRQGSSAQKFKNNSKVLLNIFLKKKNLKFVVLSFHRTSHIQSWHLHNKIPKDWLEISLDTFKVKCKTLFLQIR